MAINIGSSTVKGINVGSTVIARAFLGTQKIYDQLDYPTLDLNFAATKTLDSKITFTRASSGSYFDSNGVMQFASTNTPRFDHNPVTGESLGLLIEEQRTNLIKWSEDYTNNLWTKQASVTVTSNTDTAPDGSLTADRITADSGFGVFQNIEVSVGVTVVQSVFIKAGTANSLMFRDFNGAGRHIVINPNTGTITTTSGVLLASGSVNCGNGWFRYYFSYTTDSSGVVGTLRPDNSGLAKTFIVWGAQVEIGQKFPTSYLPTTSATTTRAADSALISGVNFSSWYNQIRGTILGEYRYLSTGVANQYAFSVNNNSANESINIITSTPNSGRVVITTGGVSQADFGSFSFSSGQLVKRAIAIASNDAATVINNGTVATDNTVNPPTPSQLSIGAANYIPGSQINGHIKRIAYWNRRLANTELQLLTT